MRESVASEGNVVAVLFCSTWQWGVAGRTRYAAGATANSTWEGEAAADDAGALKGMRRRMAGMLVEPYTTRGHACRLS